MEQFFSSFSFYLSLIAGSSIFKVIAVPVIIFCIVRFLIGIYRVTTTESGIHYVSNNRECVPVFRYQNPFSMEGQFIDANLTDGIKVTLQSERNSLVRGVWGLPIDILLDFIKRPIGEVRNKLLEPYNNFLQTGHESSNCFLINANERKECIFKPKYVQRIQGREPDNRIMRRRFPLVIFMMLTSDNDESTSENAIVLMTYAIHLFEPSYPLQSQVVDQYAKLSISRVTRVKKMYDTLSDPVSDDGTRTCIVCFERLVSVVHLPCRHSCVCESCFKHCDKCPMCRSLTPYYFKISVA